MLPNNELGKLIASTWKDTPSKEKKPIIVFADESTINQKQIKEQKIVITDFPNDVNKLLENGWRIESVTAQHVSTATSSSLSSTVSGTFCFVLYK